MFSCALLATEKETLTVEAAVFTAERDQLLVRLIGRREDKHPGVETIWPTGIRRCR